MTLGKAFSIRLETYLKEKKITLHKFIKDSGIARSTLTNLLRGNSKGPTLRIIYQTARGLGISPLVFLDCDLFQNDEIEID